ncbi:hypothetical protein ElyMa_003019400 [Elysia marginata]|uniref:Uncharacterized protein n=1 Tax=Elysia marginata TaxID=1093978 RepID=A0AAV4IF14_9GAST|nr:hypothetical protein ElyMa_003019400 [Elysia marginata]
MQRNNCSNLKRLGRSYRQTHREADQKLLDSSGLLVQHSVQRLIASVGLPMDGARGCANIDLAGARSGGGGGGGGMLMHYWTQPAQSENIIM